MEHLLQRTKCSIFHYFSKRCYFKDVKMYIRRCIIFLNTYQKICFGSQSHCCGSQSHCFLLVYNLMLYIPVNNFSVMLGWTSTNQQIKYLSCSRTQHSASAGGESWFRKNFILLCSFLSNMLLCLCLTSHQQPRSYGCITSQSTIFSQFKTIACLPGLNYTCSANRRFTFARIDISCARFFFYKSAEKVLSYARLNCAVFNYFYMSLGQVRHTIVVSCYQNHRKHNEIQP